VHSLTPRLSNRLICHLNSCTSSAKIAFVSLLIQLRNAHG